MEVILSFVHVYLFTQFFQVRLDNLGSSPDSLLLPQITLLLSSQHKKAIQRRSFDVLLAIYKQLYEAVQNPVNLYENPKSILYKTPEELVKHMSK